MTTVPGTVYASPDKIKDELDAAQKLLDEYRQLALSSDKEGDDTASLSAGVMRFSFDGDGSEEVIEITEQGLSTPANSEELTKAASTLSLYSERVTSLNNLIASFAAGDDAKDLITRTEAMKADLAKAYDAAKAAVGIKAASGFPQSLKRMIDYVETQIAQYYAFDKPSASDPIKKAYVWFDATGIPYYGASLTLKNLGFADQPPIHPIYTVCFAAAVKKNTISPYLRGDIGETLPMQGIYQARNAFSTSDKMLEILWAELEADNVVQVVNKMDLPITKAEIESVREQVPDILSLKTEGKSLVVVLNIPAKDPKVDEAVKGMRRALSQLFGRQVLSTADLRHTVASHSGGKETQVTFELAMKPINMSRPKSLLSRLKVLKYELELNNHEYDTLVKFIRNNVRS